MNDERRSKKLSEQITTPNLEKMESEIVIPEGGWQPHTLYLVEVAMNECNVIWQTFFYVGFVNDEGQPAGYTRFWNDEIDLREVYYLRTLKVLYKERAEEKKT